MSLLPFPAPPGASTFPGLRAEVRAFLAAELGPDFTAPERARSWSGFDAAFSRKLGARGWLGMTWPRAYGGHTLFPYTTLFR
mgnify:FL=1